MYTDESGSGPSVLGINHNAAIKYDYNTNNEKYNFFVKLSSINGDPSQFSWWKSKMYSYIIGVDDELWDVIKDGVLFPVDTKRIVPDKKSLSATQNSVYRKHHRVRGILVDALPHSQYTNILDKFTTEEIFESLCSTYEGK